MDNALAILKRVGSALIVFGTLDVALMIYCVTHAMSYCSSFNIFAIFAGVCLRRGHLGAARLVTWFSAFMVTGFVGAILVLFPSLQPPALWRARWLQEPVIHALMVAAGIGVIALLIWVYVQLRSPAVVKARVAAGQSATPPRFAFLAGTALVLGMALGQHSVLHGEGATKAARLAEAKAGPAYKYCVTQMSWFGEHGRASVTAYNHSEIKLVDVEW